jgi:RHS repeat-associated protein
VGTVCKYALSGTKRYSYDQIERLTGVTQQQGAAPATPVEAYTYDAEGNRVTSQVSGAAGTAPAQTYVTDDRNRVTDDGVNSYTWTPSGALASRTPRAATADNAAISYGVEWHGIYNQMRVNGINGGNAPASFYYDPFNRLMGVGYPDRPGTGNDRYFDGDDVVLERRSSWSGTPQWARYVHGPGSDQPLAFELYAPGADPVPGTGQAFYYHADSEGSVRLITDAAAQVVNRYDYDSYGNRLTAIEGVIQPYSWKGREYIGGGVNVYHNRARIYDPALGRFTTEDPMGYEAGDTNLYAFTWNNPRNWNDPSGLAAAGESAGTGGIVLPSTAAMVQIAVRISCTFDIISSALSYANDPSWQGGFQLAVDAAGCMTRVKKASPKPKPATCPYIPGQNSFSGDTMVWIKDGLKAIRDIEVGDQVLAWDPVTNQPKLETVLHTFSRITDDIYKLTLADAAGRQSTTTVTGNHPYLLAANDNAPLLALAANDNGAASGQAAPAADATILRIEPGGSWKIVRHLAPGDQIRTALNGAVVFGPGGGHLVSAPGLDTLTVVSIVLDRSPRRVHNLEVQNLASYAVGELGYGIHTSLGHTSIAVGFG